MKSTLTLTNLTHNLITRFLNDSSYKDTQFDEIIQKYLKELKIKPRTLNISEYLIPKIGPYNVITAPVYMNLSYKYLRHIRHRPPSQDAVFNLIYGDTDTDINNNKQSWDTSSE